MCNPHDASTFGKKTLPTTSSPTSMIVSSSKLKAPPPSSFKNSWVMFLLLQANPSWWCFCSSCSCFFFKQSKMWCISCLCFLAMQLFQVVMFFLLVLPNSPITPKPWCSLLFVFFESPIALKPSCSSFSCFSKCSSCLWFWSCSFCFCFYVMFMFLFLTTQWFQAMMLFLLMLPNGLVVPIRDVPLTHAS